MNGANKQYGQDLKKQFVRANELVTALGNKIDKRYDLIVTRFPQYIDDQHKRIMSTDLDHNQKLMIIIKAEDNYVRATSNQGELFN